MVVHQRPIRMGDVVVADNMEHSAAEEVDKEDIIHMQGIMEVTMVEEEDEIIKMCIKTVERKTRSAINM